MKVFFDTNVYVAEALLGETAERLIKATLQGRWRVYTTGYVLDELNHVLTEKLGFPRRLGILSRRRILQRSVLIEPNESRHVVPHDPKDSPILCAALDGGADYLVTNDRHLLALHPYEGLRIVSMADYQQCLVEQGLWA